MSRAAATCRSRSAPTWSTPASCRRSRRIRSAEPAWPGICRIFPASLARDRFALARGPSNPEQENPSWPRDSNASPRKKRSRRPRARTSRCPATRRSTAAAARRPTRSALRSSGALFEHDLVRKTGTHFSGSCWRRDHGVGLVAALQRIGNKARGLHLLDEAAQIVGRGAAALGHAHGLLDRHEAARHHADARVLLGVAFQRLPDAARDLELVALEHADAVGVVPHQGGLLERARQIKV